jgi:hypothetical protein
MALQMAVKAVNPTASPSGLFPALLVFGAYPGWLIMIHQTPSIIRAHGDDWHRAFSCTPPSSLAFDSEQREIEEVYKVLIIINFRPADFPTRQEITGAAEA